MVVGNAHSFIDTSTCKLALSGIRSLTLRVLEVSDTLRVLEVSDTLRVLEVSDTLRV